MRKSRIKDLTGKRFGRWLVIKFDKLEDTSKPDKNGRIRRRAKWLCKCDCGTIKSVRGDFVGRSSSSCGCYHKEVVSSMTKEKNYRWCGYKEIPGRMLSQLRKGAISRELVFDITLEDMWNQYIKQDKKCVFTGDLLFFAKADKRRETGNISLDRIDNSKGYTKDNIQWVRKDINRLRMGLSMEDFIILCKKVAEYRK